LNNADEKTYGKILKSSALIGSSSIINIALGTIRTKAIALLIGPAGVGLFGLYGSIADLARSIAGMGLNSSGVRQIAEAVGTGDTQRIAFTVATLRRVALILGTLGALLVLVFCRRIARFTFGDDRHTGQVALLSLAVLFGAVSGGQGAVIQGMRRISDLARMGVLGSFYGTLFSIPILYFFRNSGVAPSLVCVAAMGIITSWWYSRKIRVERVVVNILHVRREAKALLQLGLVFMSSALMTLGTAYLVRIIVMRKIGTEAAGYYQAAWTLGGLYVGLILQAMGADFYPRLTAAANDHVKCNRLVNEQAEVSLLLAGSGILATLTFAPWVIQLFYSAKFDPAVEILRWICLGMLLRVASWPMGYILFAQGKGGLIFWSELLANSTHIALVWLFVQAFGLKGAGIAFFGFYVVYLCTIYAMVRRLSQFRWSAANRRIGILLLLLVACVFGSWYVLPRMAAILIGAVAAAAAGVYSLKSLCSVVPLHHWPPALQKLVCICGLSNASFSPPNKSR
jgi:enterobacterial common antigen flippase